MKIAILKGRDKTIYPIEATLKKLFHVVSPTEAEILLILGGDGTMTHWARSYANFGIPFYGINRGTYGFLLNDHAADENLALAIEQAEFVNFPLLEAEVELNSGEVKTALAFNDVFTKTVSAQASNHRILINGLSILEREEDVFAGDGLIICTPGGSTAYNRAAGGIIIDHKSDSLCLTPVSAFQPVDFRPQLLPGDSVITVQLLEDDKRHHLIVADNVEFRKARSVTVKKSKQSVKLGFKPDNSYFRKTLELRFPWLKHQNS